MCSLETVRDFYIISECSHCNRPAEFMSGEGLTIAFRHDLCQTISVTAHMTAEMHYNILALRANSLYDVTPCFVCSKLSGGTRHTQMILS